MVDRIIAACDGACKGNPGPAAWAWVVADPDGGPGRWQAGPLGHATNNVAELTALERLLSATDPAVPLEARMDSQYAMNAVTSWLPKWKRNGWKTAGGKPVANQELVARIDALLADREVKFVYVPAHQVGGDVLNAVADHAASQAALSQQAASGSSPDGQPWAGAIAAVAAAATTGGRNGKRAAAPKSGEPARSARSIKAKYPGTCRRCGAPYQAGELIASGPKGWGHPECAASGE
jgi:ribonuclease HI